MSVKDRENSVSLLGMGADTIPKEYHRKILKKIAQLTKVIYVLNTKNNEGEQLIAKLKATHEGELERVLSDCTVKLQQCKEQLSQENRESQKKTSRLRECLMVTEKERDQIKEEQFAYRSAVEKKLEKIKSQNSEHLAKNLEDLRSNQIKQLEEVNEIRSEFSNRLETAMKEMGRKHQEKIRDLQEKLSSRAANELACLMEDHRKQIEALEESHERDIESLKLEFTNSQLETQNKLKEREDILQLEYTKGGEHLKHQISVLSNDLRINKDKLVLSEQKVEKLLSQVEEGEVGTSQLRAQLEGELEKMKDSLISLKHELDISVENHQQQSMEIKEVTTALGSMRALNVSNEGTIKRLNSEILSLQQDGKSLESERTLLQSTQFNTNEQIEALKKELGDIRRREQEIRVQSAREIEAAQANLSDSESQLRYGYLKALEELKDAHKKALVDAMEERNKAIEKLKKQLNSQKEEEFLNLKEKLEGENSKLKSSLSDTMSQLVIAQEEVKRLEYALTQKEQGFDSASSSLERLNKETLAIREDLRLALREKEEVEKEKDRLLRAIEDLNQKSVEKDKAHLDQLKAIKIKLTEDLVYAWKERLKQECRTLRQELSVRYNESSKRALDDLARLKDQAMEEAAVKWTIDKKKLLNQISDLKGALEETQNSNCASLEDTKSAYDSRIAALRYELEDQDARYSKQIEEQKESHIQVLRDLEKEFEDERNKLVKEQNEAMQKVHQANQLAVGALKRILEEDNQKTVEEIELKHEGEIARLRAEMRSEHERNVRMLEEEHRIKINRHQREMEKKITENENKVSGYDIIVRDLNTNIERRDAELSRMRDKVNSLTVAVSDLRKELEVKGHEVLATRRETNAKLQQHISEMTLAHNIETESLTAQHKHHTQLLLADFNSAKALFISKIRELEKKLSECERKYLTRESKPEDLEAIKELTALLQQQKQRIKDLTDEKRIYQLELTNREKNYNQVFNANPCVGILDPLASKHKKRASDIKSRYPSAPSLVSSSLDIQSSFTSMPGSLVIPHSIINPSAATPAATAAFTTKKDQHETTRPKRIVKLEDSPVVHKKYPGSKEKGVSIGDNLGPPLKPIESS